MYFPATRKWTQREMIPKPISRGISPTPLGMIISCHVAKSICVFFPKFLTFAQMENHSVPCVFVAMIIETVKERYLQSVRCLFFSNLIFLAGEHFFNGFT